VTTALAADVAAWTTEPGFGVYVHIPFCRHRCHYCDFNTYEGLDDLHSDYVEALVADVERVEGELPPATSVFFGGGTPTILPVDALSRILEAIRRRVGLAPGAEVTVEANPETVDERYLEGLLAAGFNRASIGVQSLVPHVLAGLGRTHSPETALCALAAARRAGFPQVSGDLIFGSPWETDDDWRRSLEALIAADLDHISTYALTVEEGTPLSTLVSTGRVPNVDPDVQAARYEAAAEVLRAAGFVRYEISNWARPGAASRHNVLYWCAGNYLGVGAGAHGHLDGRRSWSVRLPREFIARVRSDRSTEAGFEVVAPRGRAEEGLLCGLRLASGIHREKFETRYPGFLAEREDVIDELERDGLVEVAGGWLKLTERGTLLGDGVVTRIALRP
jgi:putative oxygen-independent coproporphyrinogen III oxidase